MGSRRPSLPPTRCVTQAFPSRSTATSWGSALLFGSSYSTAMYFVASPCTNVRGKRLFGSGAGLPLPPLPEKFAMTYPNTTLLSSSVNALATVEP